MKTVGKILFISVLVLLLVSAAVQHQSIKDANDRISELDTALSEVMAEQAAFSADTADLLDALGQRIAAAEQLFGDMSAAIQAHESCLYFSILENSDSVLAQAYGMTAEELAELHGDDTERVNFFGRLYIPDAQINVALYYGNAQAITDRQDSANIFAVYDNPGELIGDHNNQEFSKLFSVEVGTLGYIEMQSGDIINIRCTDVINGYNTGYNIVDKKGNSLLGLADYLMYTCRGGYRSIRICLWNTF